MRFPASHFPPTNPRRSAMVLPTTKSFLAALPDLFGLARSSRRPAVLPLRQRKAATEDETSVTPMAAAAPQYLTLWDPQPASFPPAWLQNAPSESCLADEYPTGARFLPAARQQRR